MTDPTRALRRLRRLVTEAERDPFFQPTQLAALAAAFRALDMHLATGGRLPDAWDAARRSASLADTRAELSVWTTADGRTLVPAEMTTAHLVNALAVMLRHAEYYRDEELATLDAAISADTPDGAFYALQSEIAALDAASAQRLLWETRPIYREMVEELRRRGASTFDYEPTDDDRCPQCRRDECLCGTDVFAPAG